MERPARNTWSKGLNKDISFLKVNNEVLYELKNGTIILDSEGTGGDITNALGNKLVFRVPDVDPAVGSDDALLTYPDIFQDLKIIGSGLLRDEVIIITTGYEGPDDDISTVGYGQVWRFQIDNTTQSVEDTIGVELDPNVHLMYNGLIEVSYSHRITRLIGRWENDNIGRIYWTNNFTRPRTLNLNDPDVFNTPIEDTLIVASVDLSPVHIVGYGNAGTIPRGSTLQYVYRLRTESGGETIYSTPSPLINLGTDPGEDNPGAYTGAAQGSGADKHVDIKIENLDQTYDVIEVYAIQYEYPDLPEIFKFYEGAVPSNGEIELRHDGNPDDYTPIDTAEINALVEIFIRVKDFAVKDNRLFAFNVTVADREIQNYDTRSYRCDALENVTLESTDPSTNPVINANINDLVNGLVTVPENHDCINPFNDIISISNNHIDPVGQTPDADMDDWMLNKQFKYQSGGTVLGGSGPNVDFKIITQEFQGQHLMGTTSHSPHPAVSPDAGAQIQEFDAFRYYNFKKIDINETENPLISAGGAPTNADYIPVQGEDIIDFRNEWANFKSARITSYFKGYARGEVYRFAAVFYDIAGNPSFASWIADIQMPRAAEEGYAIGEDYDSGKKKVRSIGVEFTFRNLQNISSDITGIKVVRVKRTDADKTRLATGLVSPLIRQGDDLSITKVPGGMWIDNFLSGLPEENAAEDLVRSMIGSSYTAQDTTNQDIKHSVFSFSTPDNYHKNLSGFSGQFQEGDCIEIEGMYTTRVRPVIVLGTVSSTATAELFGLDMHPYSGTGFDPTAKSFAHGEIETISPLFVSGSYGGLGTSSPFMCLSYQRGFRRDEPAYGGLADQYKRRPLRMAIRDSVAFGFGGASSSLNPPSGGTGVINSILNYKNNASDINYPEEMRGCRPVVFSLTHWNSMFNLLSPEPLSSGSGYAALADDTSAVEPNERAHLLGSWVRTKIKQANGFIDQYGGNTYEARQQNIYIDTGMFMRISDGDVTKAANVYGGDVTTHYYPQRWANHHGVTDVDWDFGTNNVKSSAFYMFVETSINLHKRHGDQFFPFNETYQGGSLADPFPDDGSGNLLGPLKQGDDDPYYNPVYNQANNIKTYPAKNPFALLANKLEHNIYYSDYKIDGQSIDGWRIFRVNNYINVEGNFGPINVGINNNDELFFIQNRAVGILRVNEKAVISAQDGTQLSLGVGNILSDFDYLSINSGTVHQASAVSTEIGVYYFDSRHRKIGRFNMEGITPESDLKGINTLLEQYAGASVINNDLTPSGEGVIAVPDLNHYRVYFTILPESAPPLTVVYNELLNAFEKTIDIAPTLYIDANKNFLGTIDGNTGYLFEAGERSTFFGEVLPLEIHFVVNNGIENIKIATNVEWLSRALNLSGEQVVDGIQEVRVYNDYQDTGWQTNIRNAHRRWRHTVKRNEGSKDRIRSPYFIVAMRFTPNFLDPERASQLILSSVQANYLAQHAELRKN